MTDSVVKTVRLVAVLSLFMSAIPMIVQAQVPITFAPLVGSEVQQAPVCFDAVTGRLGQCAVSSPTSYARSVLVAQSGTGDYPDLIAALADGNAWCPGPSEFNRCQLRIGPGIFGLGTASLDMTDFIDIRGAGIGTTVILSDVEFDIDAEDGRGVINGANAALSDLSVLNVSDNMDGNFATVVIFNQTPGFRAQRIAAFTSSVAKAGPVAAFLDDRGGSNITDSFLLAQGGSIGFGLRVQESTVTASNSRIQAFGGVDTESVSLLGEDPTVVTIRHSEVDEISVDGADSELYFHWSSAMGGATVINGATTVCLYSFDEETLVALNPDCSL